MKILLDECAPRALGTYLIDHNHDCSTVQEMGWSGKTNGELLSLVESVFEVFVSLDSKMRYQQDLSGRKIAIVIIKERSTRLVNLRRFFPDYLSAIEKSRSGEVIHVSHDQ